MASAAPAACDDPPHLGKPEARKNLRSDKPDTGNDNEEESDFRQRLVLLEVWASI